ncbi:unnamed protein product [Didymodactylos carnosus]|uniref:Uncharacterized protein n=2 Tax=Didymodactylos carnosus TaxID=1234261 RepID=A0A8S2GKM5_9BILA|nr:unnamed protein product [Didymodactylos carnosus]CAF3527198.1 unnamed protein product [Didymodactylos carnosus]
MEKFKIKIKEIDHQIRSLKQKGKGILFKIDIDNATRSFETNQINLLHLENNQSTKTDERLFDVDFSLLRKNHERFYFNSTNQQYESFILKSYFDQLDKSKQRKKVIVRMRNKLHQLNIYVLINEICFKYGSEELINYKMSRFDQIIHYNEIEDTTNFQLFDMNNFINKNDFSISDENRYRNLMKLFLEEILTILIQSKISIK